MFDARAWQAPQVELGLHESLLTTQLRDELASALSGSKIPFTAKVDDEDQAHVLARHVQAIALQVLSSTKTPSAGSRLPTTWSGSSSDPTAR